MRYPSFVRELGLEASRPKLYMGVRSGYALTIAFAALAVAGQVAGMVPWSLSFHLLVVAKLFTNTLAWIALRTNRFALEVGGVNVMMDVVVMTGAIYLTGGQLSPLFSIYVIEITVIALLTNLGTTIVIAVFALTLYSAMCLLTYWQVLPGHPEPVALTGALTMPYTIVQLGYAAFVLGVPTFFTAAILRRLRVKEQALEQRRRELIEAGKQKSQFMANITHELRTPIHGICGLSDLVETGVYGPVTDKQVQAQQAIKRAARGLLHLIDSLLQLARADAGKLEFQPAEVDLNDLVPMVVASARAMVGTNPVELSLVVDEKLPTITTDRGKLNQILVNLLSNAVKFTPDGGLVEVRARSVADGKVAILVRDTGVGIAASDLPRIFDEFRQADGSTERSYGGAGLGLTLAKRLATLLGATIEVESEPGRGSTFTVTLPIQGPPRTSSGRFACIDPGQGRLSAPPPKANW